MSDEHLCSSENDIEIFQLVGGMLNMESSVQNRGNLKVSLLERSNEKTLFNA